MSTITRLETIRAHAAGHVPHYATLGVWAALMLAVAGPTEAAPQSGADRSRVDVPAVVLDSPDVVAEESSEDAPPPPVRVAGDSAVRPTPPSTSPMPIGPSIITPQPAGPTTTTTSPAPTAGPGPVEPTDPEAPSDEPSGAVCPTGPLPVDIFGGIIDGFRDGQDQFEEGLGQDTGRDPAGRIGEEAGCDTDTESRGI